MSLLLISTLSRCKILEKAQSLVTIRLDLAQEASLKSRKTSEVEIPKKKKTWKKSIHWQGYEKKLTNEAAP